MRYNYFDGCGLCCLTNVIDCETNCTSNSSFSTPLPSQYSLPATINSSSWLEKQIFFLGVPLTVIEIETVFVEDIYIPTSFFCPSNLYCSDSTQLSINVTTPPPLPDSVTVVQLDVPYYMPFQAIDTFAVYAYQMEDPCDALSVMCPSIIKPLTCSISHCSFWNIDYGHHCDW